MSQVFTAGVRRTKDGAFLPYVDVADLDRRMEWEELHPAGSVQDETMAHARAQELACELRSGDPVPSPGERYRRAHEGDHASADPVPSRLAAGPQRVVASFVARFNLHQELLSGDHHRALLAETA